MGEGKVEIHRRECKVSVVGSRARAPIDGGAESRVHDSSELPVVADVGGVGH